MQMEVESDEFWLRLGNEYILGKPCNDCPTNIRTFRQNFGCSPLVVKLCWRLLLDCTTVTKCAKPVHLLWACLFLKVYGKESTHSSLVRCSDKTFRNWAWKFVYAISDLEPYVVSKDCFLFIYKIQISLIVEL